MDEQKIAERVLRAIEEKTFPGCVVGIVRRDDERTIIPFGTLIYQSEEKVEENTIYDVASITKSIPTASLVLLFAASNPPRFHLGGRVAEHLPELKNDYAATIEDLLRYRVRGPRMAHLQYQTFEEIRTHILENGFSGPPGESHYTNLPAFLLGMIVERVGGGILPALAHQYFFEPLKMQDTTFFPQNGDTHNSTGRQKCVCCENIAPTEIVDGKEIRGIVHDESARVFSRARRAVGHAGLFSTAPDLLNFLEALLNVGHPMSYIADGARKGLGWEVNREWMGKHRGAKAFGKTGFTGTSVVCDIERGIGLVILSNRTYPHRPADNSVINVFRKDIADIVLA